MGNPVIQEMRRREREAVAAMAAGNPRFKAADRKGKREMIEAKVKEIRKRVHKQRERANKGRR